jgi:hypothetical protein
MPRLDKQMYAMFFYHRALAHKKRGEQTVRKKKRRFTSRFDVSRDEAVERSPLHLALSLLLLLVLPIARALLSLRIYPEGAGAPS